MLKMLRLNLCKLVSRNGHYFPIPLTPPTLAEWAARLYVKRKSPSLLTSLLPNMNSIIKAPVSFVFYCCLQSCFCFISFCKTQPVQQLAQQSL
uniref:Uncharacterized protein n=1 Tax=Kryptolebias marmoratus TaxID=37003 RepID=A0A3Q3A8P9_KRYMA